MWGTDALVFPSARGKVPSSGFFSDLFRKNGIGCSPHGIRQCFLEWSVDRGVPRDAIKHALGRPVEVESWYPVSTSPDQMEDRVSLMQEWGAYVEGRMVAPASDIHPPRS